MDYGAAIFMDFGEGGQGPALARLPTLRVGPPGLLLETCMPVYGLA